MHAVALQPLQTVPQLVPLVVVTDAGQQMLKVAAPQQSPAAKAKAA